MGNYIESLKPLVVAKDHRVALMDHFSYLADTPGAEALLEDLFRQTQKVLIDEDFGELVLQFPYGTKLLA